MSLINSAIKDPLLKAVEAKVEGGLKPQTRTHYKNVVVAGMKVAENAGAKGLKALTSAEDHVKACALGAANLVLLLYKESNSRMPIEVVPPASMTLMLQAMDLLDKAKIREASNEDVVAGSKIQMERIFAALKVNKAMFSKMADEVNRIAQDPEKMELINRRAGVVKDPRASTPTDVPVEATDGV